MSATVDWALFWEYILGALAIYSAGIAVVITLIQTLRLSTGRSPAWMPSRYGRITLVPRSRTR